jgi:hypothetical protein
MRSTQDIFSVLSRRHTWSCFDEKLGGEPVGSPHYYSLIPRNVHHRGGCEGAGRSYERLIAGVSSIVQ